jgi:hypothetical protein
VKEYTVDWNFKAYPEATREYLGLLPEFFIHATQEGDTLDQVAETGEYQSPEDPDLEPYASITYLDRFTMYCYPYSITAIRDEETKETKIGRFD